MIVVVRVSGEKTPFFMSCDAVISGLGLVKNRDFATVLSLGDGFLVGAFRFRVALPSLVEFPGPGWGHGRPAGVGLRCSSRYAASSALSSTGNLRGCLTSFQDFQTNYIPHPFPQADEEKFVLDGGFFFNPRFYDNTFRVQEDDPTVDGEIFKQQLHHINAHIERTVKRHKCQTE